LPDADNGSARGRAIRQERRPPSITAGTRSTFAEYLRSATTLSAEATGMRRATSIPPACCGFSTDAPNMNAMPAMAATAASQVRSGIGSLSTIRAHTTVRSGLTLIMTRVFAVVVRESAITNAVNITAQRKPEKSPGTPAARAAARGLRPRTARNPATNANAKKLLKSTCSSGSACSM
jgi:hypothetical protein